MNKQASKWRRGTYWLSALGLIGLATLYAVRPVPVLVDTVTAVRAAMRVTVDEDGVTRIRERYVVSTPLTARLLRITFDVGDDVRANQTVLARLEPTDPGLLDPRQVAQSKARVRAAERKLESSKAELAKSKVELNHAESEMGRVRQLVDRKAASDFELDRKVLEFRQATEEARAAGFAVDIAEYELQLEQAALLLTDPESAAVGDQSTGAMELAVRAPIDGRILRIYQESTTVVSAGSPLMEIGDPVDLEIVADVLSRDAVGIQPGAQVELDHWGGDQPLKGRVRLVEPSGFTKLSALGVEEQRVNTIIDLVDPPENRPTLGDNFRVDCRITVWSADDVVQIPTSALFRVDGAWTVFVADGDVARARTVSVGHTNDLNAEILHGIEAGSKVVVHPGDKVKDGVRIAER